MTVEIKIPDIGVNEVEVVEILVKIGDFVHSEQNLIVVEGEKISMEIPSPCSGIVSMINIKIGDQVKTNSVIMLFETDPPVSVKKINYSNDKELFLKEKPSHLFKNVFKSLDKNIIDNQLNYASPFIRQLAREKNINLSCIQGTGRKNRIIKEDLDTYLSNQSINSNSKSSFDSTIGTDLNQNLNLNSDLEIKKLKLTKMQIISGKNLLNNWKNIPHVTHFDEADVTDVDYFRKKYNLEMKDKNVKVTLLSFVIKVIVKTLEKFPKFNCSISKSQDTILLKEFINIGIAVNTSKGLLVPVLKNVKNKNILEISNLLTDLSNKARLNKLSISDLQNGTFTISNLGGIGGINFTPIINASEVAILGLSKCFIKPLWNKNVFQPRLILPLSLSYDHRIINGVEAANFTNFICKYLSDIRLLTI